VLVDGFGRRPLLLTSLALMAGFVGLLALALALRCARRQRRRLAVRRGRPRRRSPTTCVGHRSDAEPATGFLDWLAVAGLLSYVAGFALGCGAPPSNRAGCGLGGRAF
jgi:uncharacterized membrane protein YfcA